MKRRYLRKGKKIKASKSPAKNKPGFLRWFQICLILSLCAAAYVMWLDYRIKSEFEGRRWALPARVYAQPFELFTGLQITKSKLVEILLNLGYRFVGVPKGAGEYNESENSVLFITRTFRYWDSEEKSRKIQVNFSENTIEKIINITGSKTLQIMRLEPQLIGKIYPEHNEDRVLLAYQDVPQELVDALIAVEDRNFFNHVGIDPKGIIRAIWINLRSGKLRQGGSTLTQQLVKNYFLSHERTFWRKFNEFIMAILLERHYSKTEILSGYINEVYLGQHGNRAIHGFGTAAEYYFARPINELSTDQLVMLVSMVRGASYYNPRRHPERVIKRRNLAINLMLEQGYLNEKQAKQASSAPLGVTAMPGWSSAKYPAFMDLVRQHLNQDYRQEDLRSEGLRIFTTLNPAYQDIADKIATKKIDSIESARNIPESAIELAGVITDIDTGEIQALIGGRDRENTGFNRALNASRPIGSLIKPAVYLTALKQPEKYNVLTFLDDKPISVKLNGKKSWVPDNYDHKSHGSVPLYIAMSRTYNLATVRLGMQLGLSSVIETLRQLGIKTDIPEYPSLFLGALELSPLQVTQMYQTLASGGFQVPLKTIRAVLDRDGRLLQRYPLDILQTVDPQSIFLIRFLLSEVVKQGTARRLQVKLPDLMPLAGKTGTTNDLRDSWFAGFGDNILAVIWLGRDDNQPAGLTGASGALEVWIEIMRELNPSPLSLISPKGIKWMEGPVYTTSGENCAMNKEFPYIEPFIPQPAINCVQEGPQEQSIENQTDKNPWSILNM